MMTDDCLNNRFIKNNRIDDRYIVVEHIDRGGMACVYKVKREGEPYLYALKLLHDHHFQNPVVRDLFLNEAQRLSDLSHPNIVRIFDSVVRPDFAYIRMEFVDGFVLSSILKNLQTSGQYFPLSEAIRALVQVERAITFLHDNNVIHRDIKAGNILVERHTGKILLADFGIATDVRSTAQTPAGGTRAYMPPEQQENLGIPITRQADVYAFGILAYEMLSGNRPFLSRTGLKDREQAEANLIRQHREAPIPSISKQNSALPPELDPIFERVLAKHPRDRYPSARAFITDLHQVLRPHLGADLQELDQIKPLDPMAGLASAPPALDILKPYKKRSSSLWLVLIIAILGAGAALLFFAIINSSDTDSPSLAARPTTITQAVVTPTAPTAIADQPTETQPAVLADDTATALLTVIATHTLPNSLTPETDPTSRFITATYTLGPTKSIPLTAPLTTTASDDTPPTVDPGLPGQPGPTTAVETSLITPPTTTPITAINTQTAVSTAASYTATAVPTSTFTYTPTVTPSATSTATFTPTYTPTFTPTPTTYLQDQVFLEYLEGGAALGMSLSLADALMILRVEADDNIVYLNTGSVNGFRVTVTLETLTDEFGIVYRVQDAANFGRLVLDPNQKSWRIESVINGETRVDQIGIWPYDTPPTQLVVMGLNEFLRIELDDTLIEAQYSSMTSGQVGLWLPATTTDAPLPISSIRFGLVGNEAYAAATAIPTPALQWSTAQFVLVDIRKLQSAANSVSLIVDCPQFIETYDTLDRHLEREAEVQNWAQQVIDVSSIIYVRCRNQTHPNLSLENDLSDFLNWESALLQIADEIESGS